MSARLDAVRKLLALHDLDAILVWNLTNVRYLSGFTGSEGALVITADKALFLSDSRYATQAAEQLKGFTPVIESQKMPSAVKQLKAARAKRIGFEDGTMTVEDHARLLGKLENAQLIGLGSKLDAIRLCKDTGEIAVMRKAAQIAEAGLDAALRVLKPGISENDVAVELELTMRREGASATSFETIIASGPRGALPHGIASDKKIAEGELVVIDWGCVYQGYCSDQTVTVAVGEVGEEEKRVYEIVREAQAAALGGLKAGVALKDVDKIAREHIREAGYGDYFGHGLGHGVGREIHEAPRLSPTSDATAEPGMVVTVEPGIYLPGRFGVRIEDTVVITDQGFDRLTSVDKQFTRIG